MDIRPIRSPEDHKAALARVEALWGADPDTPQGTELDVLMDLVEHYEDRLFPIVPSDPIEILRFVMEQNGYSQADLGEVLGSRSRASEILGGKRRLTPKMIAKLQALWHIPGGALLPAYEAA
jgi:HTH-type transcriptional regulator/antitoxin HigA